MFALAVVQQAALVALECVYICVCISACTCTVCGHVCVCVDVYICCARVAVRGCVNALFLGVFRVFEKLYLCLLRGVCFRL